MNSPTDVRDAARLVQFALDVRAMAGADPEYAALWHRYRIDDAFRSMVDAVCGGLGLAPMGAAEQGLIVVPQDGSVFAMGPLSDIEVGLTPDRRVVYGLAHLGIAACAYPRPEDLERGGVVRVRISAVERLLRDTARSVAEERHEVADDTRAAFELLAEMPTRKPGAQRRSRTTSQGVIAMAFDRLVEHGCARKVAERDGDAEYQMLERYRLQVGEIAVVDAYDALCAAASAPPAADEGASDLGGPNGIEDDLHHTDDSSIDRTGPGDAEAAAP